MANSQNPAIIAICGWVVFLAIYWFWIGHIAAYKEYKIAKNGYWLFLLNTPAVQVSAAMMKTIFIAIQLVVFSSGLSLLGL